MPQTPTVSTGYDCDVLVVGSGAGGATLAHACARAGRSVILLERGRKYPARGEHDEQAMLIDRKPYDDRQVEVNGTPRRLYMGGVLGGGTALYGGALLRPSRDDFHPGRHYAGRIPRPLWSWPIGYDDLAPWYAAAERLYSVSGPEGDDLHPLERPPQGYPGLPLPLHPINLKLMKVSRKRGLRPFQLPLAIEADSCLRCHACAGHVCPTGARRSSSHLVDQAGALGLPLEVRTGVEVERLRLENGKVTGACLRDRATGKHGVLRARRYVLAAGAIGSPLLLLRSGIEGPEIGRNYMMHLSPVVVGFFPKPTGADTTFVKQVGFADYYLGTNDYPHKLGLVQSLPVPGPLMLEKTAPRLLPRRLLPFLRRRMLPLVGTLEDLPSPANRVSWGADGRPRLRHRHGGYDLERGRQLGRMMARILRAAGAVVCLARRFPSHEHVAHQCGTLRFGSRPEHAVLDPGCRMFQHPNVFVADASFFPTSLGVGPALTIMANALRVAAIVSAET